MAECPTGSRREVNRYDCPLGRSDGRATPKKFQKMFRSGRWIFPFTVLWGCTEENAMAPTIDLIQVDPQTVEIILPFADFVEDVQVLGGFGSTSDLDRGIVARDFSGLNAKTLMRFGGYPDSISVADQTGTVRVDSDLTFMGGHVLLFFDTLSGSVDQLVDLELFTTQQSWHAPTATWGMAVDTAGDHTSWVQPGGGTAISVGSGTFDRGRSQGDTVAFVDFVKVEIDAATVASWADTSDASRGLLVTASTPGTQLNLVRASLRLDVVPSVNPDTTVEVSGGLADVSYIYDPAPELPVGWLRVGGAPSWRSIITLKLPRMIGGSPEICGGVGCQFDVTRADLNLAELILTTRVTESPFEPSDTTRMDIRTVLHPDRIPKSPLGDLLSLGGATLPPEIFAQQSGSPVTISLTGLMSNVLKSETVGDLPSSTIALVNSTEPGPLGFASFDGSGGAGAPALRLVLTLAGKVGLP